MPSFKSNLDIQQHQLLNAVLHNLPDLPQNPVEGQMFFDSTNKVAMIWSGSKWAIWGKNEAASQIIQFTCNLGGPVIRSGSLILRLYQDLTVLRIDSHIDTGNHADFNIEHRSSVNTVGTMLTSTTIQALPGGTQTSSFALSSLTAGNWLYLDITNVSGTVNRLTITITCITN